MQKKKICNEDCFNCKYNDCIKNSFGKFDKLEYNRQYYQDNKDKCKDYAIKYYYKNKDKILQRQKDKRRELKALSS